MANLLDTFIAIVGINGVLLLLALLLVGVYFEIWYRIKDD